MSDLKMWQKLVFFGFAISITALGARELYRCSPSVNKIDTELYFQGAFGPRSYEYAINNKDKKNDFTMIKKTIQKFKKGEL